MDSEIGRKDGNSDVIFVFGTWFVASSTHAAVEKLVVTSSNKLLRLLWGVYPYTLHQRQNLIDVE